MRIGIDGRFIHETGIGVYTLELLDAMLKQEHDFVFVLFLKPDTMAFVNQRFTQAIQDGKLILKEVHFGWYGVREQLKFPRCIKTAHIDLMHFPHFNVAVFSRVPFVVTIHDLILLAHPSIRATHLAPWKFWLKKQGYLFVIRYALTHSRAIVSLTQFGKDDILQRFPRFRDKEKIIITSEGAGQTSLSKTTPSDKSQLFKYNIKKSFLLYVGNAYPHKNLEGLVLAFTELLKEGRDYQLVIVGKDDDFRKELKVHCKNLGLWGNSKTSDTVIFTGYVNDDDLAALYQHASVYVFPSLYEGFALPQLEAMRYGLPVVSSNQSCLPEILADAVEYFDPEDPSNIVAAIRKVIDSPVYQKELRGRGYKKVLEYRWDECAQKTLQVYKQFFSHAVTKKK